jgi:hypothetical protein
MPIRYEKPNWIAASGFARFLASTLGLLVRVVGGVAIVAGALRAVGGTAGHGVAAIGLVPILAGTSHTCVFRKLFGGLFAGAAIRTCAIRWATGAA